MVAAALLVGAVVRLGPGAAQPAAMAELVKMFGPISVRAFAHPGFDAIMSFSEQLACDVHTTIPG